MSSGCRCHSASALGLQHSYSLFAAGRHAEALAPESAQDDPSFQGPLVGVRSSVSLESVVRRAEGPGERSPRVYCLDCGAEHPALPRRHGRGRRLLLPLLAPPPLSGCVCCCSVRRQGTRQRTTARPLRRQAVPAIPQTRERHPTRRKEPRSNPLCLAKSFRPQWHTDLPGPGLCGGSQLVPLCIATRSMQQPMLWGKVAGILMPALAKQASKEAAQACCHAGM